MTLSDATRHLMTWVKRAPRFIVSWTFHRGKMLAIRAPRETPGLLGIALVLSIVVVGLYVGISVHELSRT